MELIEIVKNVEAANSAIEKLGLNPYNERKPFAVTISVRSLHGPLHQLGKGNSAFFYDYRHIWDALIWTFGDLGRAILENPDYEAFDSEEGTSTFISEFETKGEYKERVIAYVNVIDMR